MPPDPKLNEKSDEELVRGTLCESSTYAHLMARYETKLLRYICRIASFSREEAEDVLQETFIKAYRNLNDFDQSLKFSSWIYRITHNEAINALRTRNRFPQTIETAEGDPLVERLADSLDLEHAFDQKLRHKRVMDALESLDQKYRDVLILKFLEEKSYEEIADVLAKPMGTVGTLIKRGRAQLIRALHHV